MDFSALTVVGIGASAGGLEAVSELLGALPPVTGMAFVVVQHLDPRHESLLAEILETKTAIPVSVAMANEPVERDHVYVTPADAILTIRAGRIELTPRSHAVDRSLPIDLLFTSLASACGESAIAVVLSGGGADGSRGVQAVRQAGGITFAQTPASANFPEMPGNAIATDCVDFVLRPREIAKELVRLSQLSPGAPQPVQKTVMGNDASTEEKSLRHIFQRVKAAHGVDFSHYKRTTIWRRLERRMALRRMESLDEYRAVLDNDPAELAALYQDFLIRVTAFFRDPDSFDVLRSFVFPALLEGRSPRQPIRLWVPGCATGEEVYSITIALLEYLGDAASSRRVQVFGTDVSDMSIEKARAGSYPVSAFHDVSPERVERFFVRENEEYRVVKEVRALCLFARQDVTRDPPFSRLDLISCRNLFIYLDNTIQQRVLKMFHYALRPEGMLLFGPAETIGPSTDLFEQVDKRYRAYRRLPNGSDANAAPLADFADAAKLPARMSEGATLSDSESAVREADRLLLGRFAPASVLINHAYTILQFRGDTGPYLEPAAGVPSFDLRRVVRPELVVHIRAAIEETRNSGAPSRREVPLSDGREAGIEIIPLSGAPNAQFFLILFEDASRLRTGNQLPASISALPESEKDRHLVELERDLGSLRAYLRSAIEEHSAIQEELRAAHEEMLSSNEEFQTTNEELETSKEELQSANEELTTTIDELRHRNQELADLNTRLDETRIVAERARSYADIIIDTVHEPLAVLDNTQRILRVNPAFVSELGIPREEAEGHLLRDVDGARWKMPELPQRLRRVLRGEHTMEGWEVALELPGRGRRVMSLTARKLPGDAERAELLLLSFEDVTNRVNREADLAATNARKDDFLALLGHELRHPLTPITHAVYLLKRGRPDAPAAELLDTIETETRRLVRFVDELLDVARINRGLMEVQHDRIDLLDVVRAAVRAAEPYIKSRGHTLSRVLPASPVFVSGDAGRLNQAITNVLENAGKYTEPGGQITLTFERRGEGAVISVRDNGIGIAREDLGRIFEPFVQAQDAFARRGGGLGLGLNLTRRVVELHGGHIEAHSAGLGKGSEFVVWLPVLATAAAPPQKKEPASAEPATVGSRHPRKVLIVDDHEEVAISLGRLVRALGHEVVIATDASSAEALAETFHPDFGILDLALNGVSGIELGRRLRQRFPRDRLFLLAMSGFATASIREECLAAGFDEYFVKPGEINRLQELLDPERGATKHAAVL